MFSRFLNAIQSRLAGVLVAGVFRRFETHQAIQDAELQASLEAKARLLREQGCIAAAEQLETQVGQVEQSGVTAGLAFAKALLADSYGEMSHQADSTETSLALDSSSTNSDPQPPSKQRGRKKRSSSEG